MAFVAAWKATSIILTGAFGILGLLKDFKDKATDKITIWGRVSLIGIVVSTLLGVVAQVKETSDDERARTAVSNQTLKLVANTQTSVRDVERMLSPIDQPTFILLFKFPCASARYTRLCTAFRPTDTYYASSKQIWQKWPDGPKIEIPIFIEFFDSIADAKRFAETGANDSHLEYLVSGSFNGSRKTIAVHVPPQRDVGTIQIKTDQVDYSSSDRTYVSTLDLRGKIVLIAGQGLSDKLLNLSLVSIQMKNGQELAFQAPDIERIAARGPRGLYAFVHRFPG